MLTHSHARMHRLTNVLLSRFLLNVRDAGEQQTLSTPSCRSQGVLSLGGSIVFHPVDPENSACDAEDVGDIDIATGVNAVQSGEGPIEDWTELSRDFQEEARPQMEIAHTMVSEI